MPTGTLLTFNPGSSSIKLGLFEITADGPGAIGRGVIDLGGMPLTLLLTRGEQTTEIPIAAAVSDDLHAVIEDVLGWISRHFASTDLEVVGHRVVHGGDAFKGPVAITADTLAGIEALIPLAPLHQPRSVSSIKAVSHLRPGFAKWHPSIRPSIAARATWCAASPSRTGSSTKA